MLYITVEADETFDELKNEFVSVKQTRLQLEHSLVSISKWESIWHKSFLENVERLTPEEYLSYIKCMTMTQNVDPETFNHLSVKNLKDIQEYINDPMTATVINNRDNNQQHKHQVVTAELVYCWMLELNIPVEFQKWHLNRLMMLIQVCSIRQAPPKKKSKAQAAADMRAAKARARARRKH